MLGPPIFVISDANKIDKGVLPVPPIYIFPTYNWKIEIFGFDNFFFNKNNTF